MRPMTLAYTLAGLWLAFLLASVPAASAHDAGCVGSVHGLGVHVHGVCDSDQTPQCFGDAKLEGVVAEYLCGDPQAADCAVLLHVPGLNARLCV